jgi:hypothetical protein
MGYLEGLVGVALAVCTVSLATPAFAGPTKAWAAAKTALPADTSIAIAVDVTALSKSKTFQKLLPPLLGSDRDMKQGLDELKATCKIDPLVAIKSLVVGLDATQSDGAVFMDVAGLNPGKLHTCLQQIAKAKGKEAKAASLQVKTVDHITEMSNESKHLYFGWVGSDVLVMVPKHLDDRDALKAWMGGGFAKGALSKTLEKVNTNSALFIASIVGKVIDANYTIKQGFGWLTLEKGNLFAKVDADLGSEASAKAVVAESNADLEQLRKNPPLPKVAELVKHVTITQSGSEMVMTGTAPEKDVAEMLSLLVASM